jgi:hypothetical protein
MISYMPSWWYSNQVNEVSFIAGNVTERSGIYSLNKEGIDSKIRPSFVSTHCSLISSAGWWRR